MTTPSTFHLQVARRLCEHECGNDRTSARCAVASVRVFEKIFLQLAPVVGGAGVVAVFSRSAAVAKRDVPALAKFVPGAVRPQDAANALVDCLTTLSPEETLLAATQLYATFLALMTMFIGEPLTLQMLKGAWPDVAMNFEETP